MSLVRGGKYSLKWPYPCIPCKVKHGEMNKWPYSACFDSLCQVLQPLLELWVRDGVIQPSVFVT